MDLSPSDHELLQLLAVEVPWAMVCGEFHGSYGSVEKLVERLFEMRAAGLVRIGAADGGGEEARAAALIAEAAAHGNFEDIEDLAESAWRLAATNAGYALIKAELDGQ